MRVVGGDYAQHRAFMKGEVMWREQQWILVHDSKNTAGETVKVNWSDEYGRTVYFVSEEVARAIAAAVKFEPGTFDVQRIS